MFIQTETTPNPNVLKFLPGVEVMGQRPTCAFTSQEAAQNVPLAAKLFSVASVQQVFMGKDFISISKSESVEWSSLKIHLLSIIMDYFVRHQKVEVKEASVSASTAPQKRSSLEKEIIYLIETKIRPAVANDGGDILFDRFEEGIVYLRMQGACSNCPSSTATLKSGIENMLKYYIPQIQEVRAVASEDDQVVGVA